MAKAWESSKQGNIGVMPMARSRRIIFGWVYPKLKTAFMADEGLDYGSGDLGNDGVHRLDMAYAALSAAVETEGEAPLRMPRKISGTGGKWYIDDDQEWPDTMQVSYEYPGKPTRVLTYEMRVWARTIIWVRWKGTVFGDKGIHHYREQRLACL